MKKKVKEEEMSFDKYLTEKKKNCSSQEDKISKVNFNFFFLFLF